MHIYKKTISNGRISFSENDFKLNVPKNIKSRAFAPYATLALPFSLLNRYISRLFLIMLNKPLPTLSPSPQHTIYS